MRKITFKMDATKMKREELYNKNDMIFADEFYRRLPISKIVDARKKAVANMTKELIEISFGKLLGGKMTIKIEFDQRTDAQKAEDNFKSKEDKWVDQNLAKGKSPSLLH